MEAYGMGKDLSKMSLEELWELFPIFLVPHDDQWKDSFNYIEEMLTGLLSEQPVDRISHIGSTSIQGIWAKNIIDVMVEIPQSADMKDIAQILEQNGFIIMSS
jgi:GrpB-like predicted nucleotidyltransferase (UPF0157 family)